MSNPLAQDDGPQATSATAPLAVLESALWQRLGETADEAEFASAWLALQLGLIPAARSGILRTADRGRFALAASWPETDTEPAHLRQTAELALAETRAIARGGKGAGQLHCVAVPILIDERPAAVVAVAIELAPGADGKAELRAAIRQLQWGAAWLRDRLGRRQVLAAGETADRSRAALDFIAAVLDQDRFSTAAMAAATELAIRFDCARVSIGFRSRASSRVAAISHTASFGRRMTLVRNLGAAMDEAVDQRATILYPTTTDLALATHAHAALARMQHDGPVLTIPIFSADHFIGAVTFERARGDSFEPGLVSLLDVIVATVGPILEEKRRNDRWIGAKAAEAFGQQLRRLFGPRYVGRKLVLVGLLVAAGLLSILGGVHRVTADAEIEGSVRRAVVSAYDGYIQDATVRAGQTVRQGDVLATLEDRELALERLRWVTERQQREFEYDRALATRQPAAINVVRAQIDQADAQIGLIDEQIARTRLVAPFDGLVVAGDLSQRIGAAVSRGELLFEIAPLTDYRVVMRVDERLVAAVAAGQTGEVVFTALPDERYRIAVEKVTPVAQSRDGQNLFQVEGSLEGASDRLRPGMIGVAKIDIGEELLVTTWLRPVIDWFRLATWRWFG